MIHHDVGITVIARSKRRRHRRHLDDESLGRQQSLTQEVVVGRKGLHHLHKSQRSSPVDHFSSLDDAPFHFLSLRVGPYRGRKKAPR